MKEIRGAQVVLRPMEPSHHEELVAIHQRPEVLRWWGVMDEQFPLDEPTARRYAVLVDDAIAGLIQWGEEREPDYRYAWIDIFLAPEFHGRGHGTDAVRTLAEHLLDECHHHRVTIDPAVANTAAVRAYEKAGFRTVGVTEASWRGPDGEWYDCVLMEIVRRPEPQGHPKT